jgi:small subunit ribosomal protein S2
MPTLEEMLDVGVHFGHQAKKWNPKMARHIYGERKGIHILDLIQTAILLDRAKFFARTQAAVHSSFLFVGTKSQAASILKPAAERCQQNDPSQVHYVTHRWLGGMLTNWPTMQMCIRRLLELQADHEQGRFDQFPKKEAALARKQLARLEKHLGGVKNMKKIPSIVVIVGQPQEMNAVRECEKLGLAIVTMLDTDCNPDLTDIGIPSNDDSIASIELVIREITKGIEEGQWISKGGGQEATIEWFTVEPPAVEKPLIIIEPPPSPIEKPVVLEYSMQNTP